MQVINFVNITILVILNVNIWLGNYQTYQRSLNNFFEVTFLDIGQGDSILVKTPENQYGLIDTGKDKNILTSITKIINPGTKIDFVILTHADADHIEGFLEISRLYDVENVFVNNTAKENELIEEIKNALVHKDIQNYSLRKGNNFSLGSISIEVIWPNTFIQSMQISDENDRSISVIATYQDCDVALFGDLSKDYEMKAINNMSVSKKVEILKLSHHGSQSSTSLELLETLGIELAIIQVGKSNSYGHPHNTVLDILTKAGIDFFRTDQDKQIKIQSSGKEFWIKDNKTTKKYNCG